MFLEIFRIPHELHFLSDLFIRILLSYSILLKVACIHKIRSGLEIGKLAYQRIGSFQCKDTNSKERLLCLNFGSNFLSRHAHCTAHFERGSHRLRFHLYLLHYCWNYFWNHICFLAHSFLSFLLFLLVSLVQCSLWMPQIKCENAKAFIHSYRVAKFYLDYI